MGGDQTGGDLFFLDGYFSLCFREVEAGWERAGQPAWADVCGMRPALGREREAKVTLAGLGPRTASGPHIQRGGGSGAGLGICIFNKHRSGPGAPARPSLPVSVGCGLAERVHVPLGGCRNSIPVHGSYQWVRASLQQQTNQLKIACKPREGVS